MPISFKRGYRQHPLRKTYSLPFLSMVESPNLVLESCQQARCHLLPFMLPHSPWMLFHVSFFFHFNVVKIATSVATSHDAFLRWRYLRSARNGRFSLSYSSLASARYPSGLRAITISSANTSKRACYYPTVRPPQSIPPRRVAKTKTASDG